MLVHMDTNQTNRPHRISRRKHAYPEAVHIRFKDGGVFLRFERRRHWGTSVWAHSARQAHEFLSIDRKQLDR